MLNQLDAALDKVLRDKLSSLRFELSFDPPDEEWRARRTGPALNLFLWDIRRSESESSAGRELIDDGKGARWRPSPPRIEFQYLLTAWTDHVVDEHRMLGEALMAILATPSLSGDRRPAFLPISVPDPTIRIAHVRSRDIVDFWGALDGRLRAGLHVIVTASVDPDLALPAGAPVSGTAFGALDRHGPEQSPASPRLRRAGRVEPPLAADALVVGPNGTALVNDDGTFLIAADVGDELFLSGTERRAVVPPKGEVVL